MGVDAAPVIRLPLSRGTELRVGRWIGRIVSVTALWPLWYAFHGKSRFDWEALTFGAPGVALGLALWWFCGHRLRNPREALELDEPHRGEQ